MVIEKKRVSRQLNLGLNNQTKDLAMIRNTAPKPKSKPQVYVFNNQNTISYSLSGGWIHLFDLYGDSFRFDLEEWQDREHVDHTVSQFHGFHHYYMDKYKFH